MPNNTMLFRHPGPHKQDSVSFDYVIVPDEDIDATVADGWSRSVPAAKAAFDGKQAHAAEPVADTPPTRSELEQKAAELGIKFDGRTSDKKLAAAVAEALKA